MTRLSSGNASIAVNSSSSMGSSPYLTAAASCPGRVCRTGDNEIDRPLLDLLQQNIDAATAAGQIQAAEFMGKVRAAAMKFLITA